MKETIHHSSSPAETAAIADGLAKRLQPGDVVALCGDLGTGKTVFAQAIGKALGVRSHMHSPSYTIQLTYEASCRIHHIDLYRLQTADDIDMLDLAECWNGAAITVIEWAERAGNLLPPETIYVYLEPVGTSTHRTIRIKEPAATEERNTSCPLD
jgi:tRNA threonylcarbamoyladenosine biosynthesis protein TsaE